VNAVPHVASTRLWKLCVYQIAIHVFTPDSSKSEYLQSKFQLRYHSVISNDSGLLHMGESTYGADLHF